MSLLASSTDLITSPCTTPPRPRTYQCPDAPRATHRPQPYCSHSRRSSSPRIDRRNRSQALGSSSNQRTRQIRPAPAITTLSVFTSLAFAEAARDSDDGRQSVPPSRPTLERFHKYLTPSDLELEFRTICLNHQQQTRQDRLAFDPMRSMSMRRQRDRELSELVPEYDQSENSRIRVVEEEMECVNLVNSSTPPPPYREY
ncbi:hypothetical protein CROQUDRAFT_431072 [Cronartium quercuum f. sp. fusiforme G11]|uniref:Uncharacterized protein n=1 Tax=Cronartium quercuum f. sp. fusiforme G11 TaxID=708437 RepID=A0A9P6NLG3_9BASI|nr:hypothetical protein CROQUDRAFT_431072 [Cronartium quercuum f. sp. fusiforme G11]